jgi:hypothetical protein
MKYHTLNWVRMCILVQSLIQGRRGLVKDIAANSLYIRCILHRATARGTRLLIHSVQWPHRTALVLFREKCTSAHHPYLVSSPPDLLSSACQSSHNRGQETKHPGRTTKEPIGAGASTHDSRAHQAAPMAIPRQHFYFRKTYVCASSALTLIATGSIELYPPVNSWSKAERETDKTGPTRRSTPPPSVSSPREAFAARAEPVLKDSYIPRAIRSWIPRGVVSSQEHL